MFLFWFRTWDFVARNSFSVASTTLSRQNEVTPKWRNYQVSREKNIFPEKFLSINSRSKVLVSIQIRHCVHLLKMPKMGSSISFPGRLRANSRRQIGWWRIPLLFFHRTKCLFSQQLKVRTYKSFNAPIFDIFYLKYFMKSWPFFRVEFCRDSMNIFGCFEIVFYVFNHFYVFNLKLLWRFIEYFRCFTYSLLLILWENFRHFKHFLRLFIGRVDLLNIWISLSKILKVY